jgi:hypothetical protein
MQSTSGVVRYLLLIVFNLPKTQSVKGSKFTNCSDKILSSLLLSHWIRHSARYLILLECPVMLLYYSCSCAR